MMFIPSFIKIHHLVENVLRSIHARARGGGNIIHFVHKIRKVWSCQK